jgi:hypothetical protein
MNFPAAPETKDRRFPTRAETWILAILAIAFIVLNLTGLWTPLDIFTQ